MVKCHSTTCAQCWTRNNNPALFIYFIYIKTESMACSTQATKTHVLPGAGLSGPVIPKCSLWFEMLFGLQQTARRCSCQRGEQKLETEDTRLWGCGFREPTSGCPLNFLHSEITSENLNEANTGDKRLLPLVVSW